jgi:hypothetical protein
MSGTHGLHLRYEVRVTAVGERMFAAQVHADSDAARIDIRRDYGAHADAVCPVPEPISRGMHTLMAVYGLSYVAVDFLVDRQDRWHLVDVNPNGQWAYIPQLRGPITQALADELEGNTPHS